MEAMDPKGTASHEAAAFATAYDPREIESGVYDWWDQSGFFAPSEDNGRDPFVIIMPPPNVTGELHVGHALFVALEDIMTRWHRMLGEPTLWLPGADHAGIAGQWVVEKQLAREGVTRHDLGRERFIERVWAFMDEYRPRIREQMKILGASCDWSRFAFTMDPGPARAVRGVFKHLYDKGLIYRGERLISWCPRCRTALSDLEVKHREEQTSLWHIAYPVEGSDVRIVVATTRPETMLGDTGVAVNPNDERYLDLVGRSVRLPFVERVIPIVADEAVEMEFGTGAVKVTPGHDPNDYEIGRRAGLATINIMNTDGTLNAEAGPFTGRSIGEARAAVVARLTKQGLLDRTEAYVHSVGHCDRCDTVVEPLISKQWFVQMAPLAAPALDAARDGRLSFVPERYKGVYLNWMESIHDWCISRQIWWGHRIPIWYCVACGEVHVSVEDTLAECSTCGGSVEQDPDVLDTWFSSGLWPFSTLGWPERTGDIDRYYPGSVLETGYEILFVWVARMVFFGIEMMGELPFHTVYLNGIVRDIEGSKMSKTKGNVIDPTEVTADFGADALRYALVTQSSPGNDSKLNIQRVEDGRNFGNKLWNATRFAMRSIEHSSISMDDEGPTRPSGDLALADRWIISRLDDVTISTTRLLERYLFGEAGRQIADFIWSEFCDWYIEAAKVRLRGDEVEKQTVASVLSYTLERALRLLHPFMPFITEALWQQLPHAGPSIMIAPWPSSGERDVRAEDDFGALMGLIRGVRNARAESSVEPARWISAHVYPGSRLAAFESTRRELSFLARIAEDELWLHHGEPDAPVGALTVVAADVSASLPLAGMVDLVAERQRLQREIEDVERERIRAEQQLGNEAFVSRAPEQVVSIQRQRLKQAKEQAALLRQRLGALIDE